MSPVAVIGGGPAGLFAAEHLARSGLSVTVYERMPSVGRKLLMAGRGGLNLTHSEPFEPFVARYGDRADALRRALEAFPPAALIAWADGLGQPTFVGSSGRVFPKALKASPLLRAWLSRLSDLGVAIKTRHHWRGWDAEGRLLFEAPDGARTAEAEVALLALGGASWAKLGSNGAWAETMTGLGVEVAPFRPANVGFDVAWSPVLQSFAGQPLKSLALTFEGRTVRGEAMVTRYGLEGGAVYALAAPIRDRIAESGSADLLLDLRPDQTESDLVGRLQRPRGGQSLSNHLRKTLRLSPLETNLLREAHGAALPGDPRGLAAAIKASPLRLVGTQPLDRAISTAGGIAFSALDSRLMLKRRPGVFVAGEMLDWEAPTGGYLLQATFATALAAADGVLAWRGDAASGPPDARRS